MINLLPVLFMLLVQVQVIDWKDQLLRSDLVLQFVDGNVNPDSLAPMLAVNYTKLNSTQCVTLVPHHRRVPTSPADPQCGVKGNYSTSSY